MKKTIFLLPLLALFAAALTAACEQTDEEKEIEKYGTPLDVCGFGLDGSSLALFSVSPSKQVRFSRGNLQFQPSTGTWRFAEHQFDFAGNANANVSAVCGDWIDLFGWATSGWDTAGTAYFPWSASIVATDYGPDATSNLNDDYAKADWAWRNTIVNGGMRSETWRTLTASEWQYLLTGRPQSIFKHGAATIATINGLVILPDEWTTPPGLVFNEGFSGNIYFDFSGNNTYTYAEWSRMEAAGAIFLPAAGNREATTVLSAGQVGNYWSVSAAGEGKARYLVFGSDTMYVDNVYYRHFGFAVRPVKAR